MIYAKLNNTDDAVEQYPYTLDQLRTDHPKTSFPLAPSADDLLAFHVVPVETTPEPGANARTQQVSELMPVYNAGRWEQAWEVIDLDQSQIDARMLAYREQLTVTPWQLRRALTASGDRATVESYVADAGTGQDVKDGWGYATEFRRLDPFVAAAGQALGKTDEELDQLFELAAGL